MSGSNLGGLKVPQTSSQTKVTFLGSHTGLLRKVQQIQSSKNHELKFGPECSIDLKDNNKGTGKGLGFNRYQSIHSHHEERATSP